MLGKAIGWGKGPAVHSSAADNPGFVDSIDDGRETITKVLGTRAGHISDSGYAEEA